MKSIALLLAISLLAPVASAQDPVLVCVRSADGSCVWVNQDELPQASPVPPAPLPPQDEQALNRANLETEVWFDWRADSTEVDPLVGQPGVCARTAGRARYRFAMAMQSGDLNKILESYDWRGKSSADAEHLSDRLAALPRNGAWERSVVSGWTGEDPDASPLAADHWRWNVGGQLTYFNMRKVDDCWFIAFGDPPGMHEIVRRQREAEKARQEPTVEEPGVYQF